MIMSGFDASLDEIHQQLRKVSESYQLLEQKLILEAEQASTAFASSTAKRRLQLVFDPKVGYIFESMTIFKDVLNQLPAVHNIKQKSANYIRFTSPDLSELEASEQTLEKSYRSVLSEIVARFCDDVRGSSAHLEQAGTLLSSLDVHCALASVSESMVCGFLSLYTLANNLLLQFHLLLYLIG
eukprot:m.209936 g.209936  ORF g.209936 m.209936 type:complete len:183 (+) comp26117_c0_seq5:314-862(+)